MTDGIIMKWNEFSTMFIDPKVEVKMNMIICKLAKHSVKFFLIRHLYINVQVEKRGRITISWFPKKDFPLRSSCQSLVNNFWYYCITKESNNHKTKCYLPHFRLGQISTPTFYPRETRHVWSNLLLSAGTLAQYKTLHEEIYIISIFFMGFFLVKSWKIEQK